MDGLAQGTLWHPFLQESGVGRLPRSDMDGRSGPGDLPQGEIEVPPSQKRRGALGLLIRVESDREEEGSIGMVRR